jgi:ATP-dependent protease ClpP protease subunit
MKKWFAFKALAGGDVAELHIDDFIGDWNDAFWGSTEVTAKALVKQLSELPDTVKNIHVHINSPGGDVFAAATIANALRAQIANGRKVVTMVDGLAASAASVIAMAGETVRMADTALMMVHNPWSIAIGNAAEMRKTADTLDVIRDTIVAAYQWHSKLEAKDIVALLDAETWMDADEAMANGFATEKVEGLKAAASIDPRAASTLKVPERFADRVSALFAKPEEAAPPAPPPAPTVEASAKPEDVIALCAEAGLDLPFANALVKEGATLPAAQARAAAEKTTRAAEAKRRTDIDALCKNAKVPDLAKGLIDGGTSFEAAKAIVAQVTAMVDRVEIDGHLSPDQGTRQKPILDATAIYAARNNRSTTPEKE